MSNLQDAKKVFRKKGSCSHTFFHLMNREFGNPNAAEEKAAEPMQGGILQMGHQCGMLWGTSFASGKEAYKRTQDLERSIPLSIAATQNAMTSFHSMNDSVNCIDVTDTDFKSKWQFLKYMFSGKFLSCFTMANKFAPQAFEAAEKGLKDAKPVENPKSCASEVLKKMGATDEQAAIVSGLAGGLGLSGQGCGALSAVIWLKTFDDVKDDVEKKVYPNPKAQEILEGFYQITDYEIQCEAICGRKFNSLEEHTEYINNGGCEKVMEYLAKA